MTTSSDEDIPPLKSLILKILQLELNDLFFNFILPLYDRYKYVHGTEYLQ